MSVQINTEQAFQIFSSHKCIFPHNLQIQFICFNIIIYSTAKPVEFFIWKTHKPTIPFENNFMMQSQIDYFYVIMLRD